MIREFSVKLIESAMPDGPDYARASELSEALQNLYLALETCNFGKESGIAFGYALEVRIGPNTVSNQLTRDEDAAMQPPSSLHGAASQQSTALASRSPTATYNKIRVGIYLVQTWKTWAARQPGCCAMTY